MTAPGLSSMVAPDRHQMHGEPLFKARAIGTDAWITVGATPDDPTSKTSRRDFIEAGTEKLVTAFPGDGWAWSKA